MVRKGRKEGEVKIQKSKEVKEEEGVDLCVEDVVHVGEARSIFSGYPPSSPHVRVIVQRCLQPGGDVALKWPAQWLRL